MATTRGRWANRSEETRLRCRAQERRGYGLVQCSEDRRQPHEHQHRGRAFHDQTAPAASTPTLAPSPFGPR